MPRLKHMTPLSNFGSRTDVGCVRDHNEDSLVVAPPLYAVCDGMGGHAAGEVASEIAVQVLSNQAPRHPDAEVLADAVEAANEEILAAAADGRGREGMGTTCTAAMLEGERLIVAQVGDSRAYLLHDGGLQQITRDHSLVADMVEAGQITAEEARVHPSRSIITRALGTAPHTRPDVFELNVEAGDRLLLCSDGLSGMVEDDLIRETLQRADDPQRCASMLVNSAIEAGGLDNVTVIVVNIEGLAAKRRRKVAAKTKVTVAITIILLAAIIGVAGFFLNTYVSTHAYIGENDGKVAIYQGVPGEFLGHSFSHLVKTYDNLKVSDLTEEGLAERVTSNKIEKDSVEQVEAIIDEWISQHAQATSGTPKPGTNVGDVADAAAATNTNTTKSEASDAAKNATSSEGANTPMGTTNTASTETTEENSDSGEDA